MISHIPNDGRCIVSDKFKIFCERSEYDSLCFYELPSEPHFYAFSVTRVVAFDAEKRKTRFDGYCNVCNRYYSVAGAEPVFLMDDPKFLEKAFYATDILFGSGNEKHPLLIVGPSTCHSMIGEGFRGIYYRPIFRNGLGAKGQAILGTKD